MRTYLQRLKPGTRFRLAGMPEITGELISVSDCSATVRLDGGTREVEIEKPRRHDAALSREPSNHDYLGPGDCRRAHFFPRGRTVLQR